MGILDSGIRVAPTVVRESKLSQLVFSARAILAQSLTRRRSAFRPRRTIPSGCGNGSVSAAYLLYPSPYQALGLVLHQRQRHADKQSQDVEGVELNERGAAVL